MHTDTHTELAHLLRMVMTAISSAQSPSCSQCEHTRHNDDRVSEVRYLAHHGREPHDTERGVVSEQTSVGTQHGREAVACTVT